MNRSQNLANQLNNQTLSLSNGIFKMDHAVPQFTPSKNKSEYKSGGQVGLKEAVQKMPERGGPIAGPGTGKSDSIKTKLQVHGFVVPIEAMQKYGDLINTLISSFKPEDESREEVDAKVSDGEGWLPPYIVEKVGVDFLNNLVADATGKMPQPETGEHGEMMAANGGFADARNQTAEFWKTANHRLCYIDDGLIEILSGIGQLLPFLFVVNAAPAGIAFNLAAAGKFQGFIFQRRIGRAGLVEAGALF